MSRKSAWARGWITFLLAMLASTQVLAAACDALECPPQQELACAESAAAGGAPEMKGAWPQWHHAFADRGPLYSTRVEASPDGGTTRLAALSPDVRNVSIALLNLRQ